LLILTTLKVLQSSLYRFRVWVNMDKHGVHAQFMLCTVLCSCWLQWDQCISHDGEQRKPPIFFPNKPVLCDGTMKTAITTLGETWTERISLFLFPTILPADAAVNTSVWHICLNPVLMFAKISIRTVTGVTLLYTFRFWPSSSSSLASFALLHSHPTPQSMFSLDWRQLRKRLFLPLPVSSAGEQSLTWLTPLQCGYDTNCHMGDLISVCHKHNQLPLKTSQKHDNYCFCFNTALN